MKTHRLPCSVLFILAALTLAACARGPRSGHEHEAQGAIEAYFTAWNARDNQGMRDSLHFPHVRLASGGVTVFEAAEDFNLDFDAFIRREGGWEFSTLDKVRVAQSGPNKVHFAITFTRHRLGGEPYATHNSLWIVTNKDGRWGVRARSSYAR